MSVSFLRAPSFVLVSLLVLAGSADVLAAPQGKIQYTNRNGKKRSLAIAGSFQNPMQCIVNKLEKMGYRARDIGCFGARPHNRSAHPTGHACDVDQSGRNVTTLNRKFSYRQQIDLAKGCEKAVSGCNWRRNPDCGHFEQKSAPYSRSGARVASHHRYGERYASHPTKKRRHRRSYSY